MDFVKIEFIIVWVSQIFRNDIDLFKYQMFWAKSLFIAETINTFN